MLIRIIRCLQKHIFKTSRVVGIFGAWLLALLVLLTIAEVVLRRLFNSPLPGAFELTEIILGVSAALTLAFCAIVEGGHVEIDTVVARFPSRIQKSIVSIMYFVTSALLGLMSWQLVLSALNTYEMTAILGIRLSPFILIMAIGIALLTLVFLVHSLINMVEAFRK